jgi:non-specific protein-tyrosine kinase
MGKISEALKKAGKSDGSRLVVRKETVVVRRRSSDSPDPQPDPERPLRIPLADKEDPKPASAAPNAERIEKVHKTAPVADPEPVAAPVDRASEPAVPKEQAVADAAGRPHPAHDNPNLVMVRTPKPNQAVSSMPPGWMVVPEAGRHESRPVPDKPPTRRPIQVSYSETRVQAVDPEKLKNNRIFSFFDEIETTNQIKILRTQLLKKLEAIGGNSILVTSANPHEGKTFTSINLGVSIAKEFSRTVLIIDADLRKPTKRHAAFSTDFFSIDVEFGLTDYLKGEADMRDILINPGIERLTLIPGGKPVDNSPELLNSSRMAEMMADVKSRYGSERLVIVDGPALLPFPDAMILANYVDGVLPVVEVERTPADQLRRMIDSLKETRVIGMVLNKNRS